MIQTAVYGVSSAPMGIMPPQVPTTTLHATHAKRYLIQKHKHITDTTPTQYLIFTKGEATKYWPIIPPSIRAPLTTQATTKQLTKVCILAHKIQMANTDAAAYAQKTQNLIRMAPDANVYADMNQTDWMHPT